MSNNSSKNHYLEDNIPTSLSFQQEGSLDLKNIERRKKIFFDNFLPKFEIFHNNSIKIVKMVIFV